MVEGAAAAAGWMQLSNIVVILIIISLVVTDGSGPKDWGDTTRAVVDTTTLQATSSSSSSNTVPRSAFMTKLVQLHAYYCGSNRVCEHYSASECYRCAPCQCDASCHDYGDCCPDVPKRKAVKHIPSHLFAGVHNEELGCQSVDVSIAVLSAYASAAASRERKKKTKTRTMIGFEDLKTVVTLPTSFERYFMISRCPEQFQGDRYPCENTFGEPPVTSQSNDSFVYRNRHCAHCHGETDNVDEWQLRVSCEASKNFTSFHNSRNVGYAALMESNCTVSYSPLTPKLERRCYSQPYMISKCNDTGEVHSIDPFLQKACDNYVTPKSVDGKMYKNVFCYLCNRNNTPFTPGPGQCGAYPWSGEKSFEATLDRRDLSQDWISQSLMYDAGYDVCDDTGLYDYDERLCRPVFCTFGQRMRPGACACNPAFQKVKGLTYEIYFKLQPDVPIELSGEYDLLHRLPAEMETHLGQMLHKIQVNIEDYAMAFNTTDARGHCNRATRDLALYARVKCQAMIDQRQLQKSLISLKKRKFRIATRLWNVSLQSIPSEQPWHLMHPSRRHAPHFLSPCVTIVANNHFEKRKDGTKRVGTTTPNPEVVRARMTSPPDIRISNLLTCAQVQLLPEEYVLSSVGNTLLFKWNGGSKTIHEDRYLMDLDGNITICLSDFLSKLTNKHGRRRTDVETMCAMILLPISMSCLLVCLVVFAIFPVLRSLSGKNNIILVACLFLSQLAIFIGYIVDSTSVWCTITGVFCHYFSLSLFLTLAFCSYHVYTIFNVMHLYVDITKETRAFIRYCCCIFAIPLLLIVIIIIVFSQLSAMTSDVGYGGGPICFLSSTTAMWLTLFLPLTVTTVIAFVLFSMTFCTLKNNADLETNATDERHVHFYFRAAILTAITWVVGAAALHAATSGVRIAFLFCHLVLGIYIMVGLVCTRRVAGLVSTLCCSGTSRAKNLNIIKMDSVKASGTSTSHPSVIVTGFRQKDSPKIYGNNDKPFFRGSNGYSTDESQA